MIRINCDCNIITKTVEPALITKIEEERGGRGGITIAAALMIIGFVMAIFGIFYLWWGPDSTIILSGVIGGIGLIVIIISMIIPRHR
jgi:hypothetical protein